jgi:uncharacterized Zn finger protein (UPF0148 family)
MSELRACETCGTTSADKYKGMRKGRVQCAYCYHKERVQLGKAKKQKARIYSMWGE